MNTNQLIKSQETPKKRINALAKQYAKDRAGIQASEKDITTRDMFEATFEYLRQLEVVLTKKAVKKDDPKP